MEPTQNEVPFRPLQAVHDFHVLFQHPHPSQLTNLKTDLRKHRTGFMIEEAIEFAQAGEFVLDSIDACIDAIYFALGNLVCHGVTEEQFQAAFSEVHRANMSKAWPDGQLHHDTVTGKVLKPEGWKPPILGPIFGLTAGQELIPNFVPTPQPQLPSEV